MRLARLIRRWGEVAHTFRRGRWETKRFPPRLLGRSVRECQINRQEQGEGEDAEEGGGTAGTAHCRGGAMGKVGTGQRRLEKLQGRVYLPSQRVKSSRLWNPSSREASVYSPSSSSLLCPSRSWSPPSRTNTYHSQPSRYIASP